ncbi:MAG: DUF58 domain-containing protein [Phycisphaerae bacterium]|nr:DUF58 domain-containing protein [Phycisphaerae bacterium]
MPPGKTSDHDYLDPQVLAGVSGLELRARMVVEGFFAGMHRSPRQGVSVEFADHRAYTQGDDLRHIDWKVFGRTDKYYVKRYRQESNLTLLLVVDCSESMGFRSPASPWAKYDYAATAAGAIAYLALRQQDSVGLALFDDQLQEFVRPSNNAHYWLTLTGELQRRLGGGKTRTGAILHELADRLVHRTLVVLISDLFDDEDEIIRGLRHLRSHRHEPIVWNVWDNAELAFPLHDLTRFEGMEALGMITADAGAIRDSYLAEVDAFQARIRRACGRSQIEYAMFDTSAPLGAALSSYLAARNTRLRWRSARVTG